MKTARFLSFLRYFKNIIEACTSFNFSHLGATCSLFRNILKRYIRNIIDDRLHAIYRLFHGTTDHSRDSKTRATA